MATRHIFGGGWTESEPTAEINMVPLIDVFMVMLVVFMITAPIVTPTLEVQLPRVSLTSTSDPNQTLVITIDRRARIAVNENVLGPLRSERTLRQFEKRVNEWKASYPGAPAFLRVDRLVRYGTVIQVMARLNRLGIVNVGLMIDPETN